MVERIRFYMDEHVPTAVAEGLKRRGVDGKIIDENHRSQLTWLFLEAVIVFNNHFRFVFSIILLCAPIYAARSNEVAIPAFPGWSIVSVAHRGGIVPGYPENSLAAFRRSVALGMDVIEIDLRGTRDGEIVIMHDADLERTTSGKGPVTECTLAELKQLDLGGGERIPTYEDVLKAITLTRVKLLLDIKVSPVLDKEKVIRLTKEYGGILGVIVGVRTLDDLREFQTLDPNLRTLGFISKPEDIESFCDAGINMIRLWPQWIRNDPLLVKKAHRLGRPVWTTACDATVEELKALIGLGVNGILTDYPERLLAARQSREIQHSK